MSILAALVCAVPFGSIAAPAERSGEEIVKAQCSKCHAQGLYGAPRIDDREAWVPRMKQGLDATVRSAINGHGKMPARGGLVTVTDAELRSAIAYMFNPAGIPPKPAPPAAPPANQRTVDGTEVYLGVTQRGENVYYVNVTLRDKGTRQAIGDAQVEARVSNPVMGADSRKLERVSINDVVSYGNEFRIVGREPHKITLQIRRPGKPRVIEASFDFRG
jgi:cytochrome c5